MAEILVRREEELQQCLDKAVAELDSGAHEPILVKAGLSLWEALSFVEKTEKRRGFIFVSVGDHDGQRFGDLYIFFDPSAVHEISATKVASALLGTGGVACGVGRCPLRRCTPWHPWSRLCVEVLTFQGLHILWQTGSRYHDAYAKGYASTLPNVHCVPFIRDMATALSAADLLLSRAGASTVAELAACGAPALLLPSPARGQEAQPANARALAEAGLALLVPQEEVDEHGIAPRLLAALAACRGDTPAPAAAPLSQSPGAAAPEAYRAASGTPGPAADGPTPPVAGVGGPQGTTQGGGGGSGSGGPGVGGSGGPTAGGGCAALPLPPAMLAAMRAGGEGRSGDAAGFRRSLARGAEAILACAARARGQRR